MRYILVFFFTLTAILASPLPQSYSSTDSSSGQTIDLSLEKTDLSPGGSVDDLWKDDAPVLLAEAQETPEERREKLQRAHEERVQKKQLERLPQELKEEVARRKSQNAQNNFQKTSADLLSTISNIAKESLPVISLPIYIGGTGLRAVTETAGAVAAPVLDFVKHNWGY